MDPDTRRPPGHPGPRGFNHLHGFRGAATLLTQDPDKAGLRLAARERRRALHAAQPDAGAEAARQFPAEAIAQANVAALYWPAGSEIDPRPLAARLVQSGARLCLPAVTAAGAGVAFREWRFGAPLARDLLGLPSPGADAPVLHPDLLVAPLLAFDRAGGRLGQGGGYYDRTIAQLRAAAPVFVLGLAFAGQEVEALPMEPHDQRLDAVLTETGLRRFAKDAPCA